MKTISIKMIIKIMVSLIKANNNNNKIWQSNRPIKWASRCLSIMNKIIDRLYIYQPCNILMLDYRFIVIRCLNSHQCNFTRTKIWWIMHLEPRALLMSIQVFKWWVSQMGLLLWKVYHHTDLKNSAAKLQKMMAESVI